MNWDEYYMRHVYLAASKSKDPRTKIGAVLVRDNRLISSGFNGFPYKVNDSIDRYNDRELKYAVVVHAEANAVLQCALLGQSSKDSILYTQGVPCSECCKSIIQGGVKKIVVHQQWPNQCHVEKWIKSFKISEMMLKEAEVVIEIFDGKLGLTGQLDGQTIEV